MTFSRDVLEFLDTMLGQVTLSAGFDDFEEKALVVVKAKREMAEALNAAKPAD